MITVMTFTTSSSYCQGGKGLGWALGVPVQGLGVQRLQGLGVRGFGLRGLGYEGSGFRMYVRCKLAKRSSLNEVALPLFGHSHLKYKYGYTT